MAGLSRHLADENSDGDLFLSHSRAVAKDGIIIIGFFAFVIILVLIYLLFEFRAMDTFQLPVDYSESLNQGLSTAL
jgi:hypothetical protein